LFVGAAVVVWLAGTRLTRYADTVSARAGLSRVLIGALLLGGITSLPELATTTTAVVGGNAELAVNNIFGGVAFQLAILAAIDAFIGRQGLSTLAGSASLLLQGTGLMLVLGLAAGGVVAASVIIFGVDLWTFAVLVAVIAIFSAIQRYEAEPDWQPTREVPESHGDEEHGEALSDVTNRRLLWATISVGLVVIAAGYLAASTGDAIAEQTGLGSGVVGAVFLAAATSLPEVSTTLEAVKLRRHRLAFSNIFGTNLFDVALLFVADLFYRDGAVLDETGGFASFAAMLGLVLTGVYVIGILQRRKRIVFRMGLDSLLVLVIYIGGVAVLFGLG
jgi:cation:H+ antiporter